LKAEEISDGAGGLTKIYSVTLPNRQSPLYVKLLSGSTLVLSPTSEYIPEALAKEAGRKQTALKEKELRALLAQVDPRWSIWAVAPGSTLEHSPLGETEEAKNIVTRAHDVSARITIGEDFNATLKFTARELADTEKIREAVEEDLVKVNEVLPWLLGNSAEMKPLLDVLRNIKPSVEDRTVTIEAVFRGSDAEKAFPKP
jgi:hypothetical protein